MCVSKTHIDKPGVAERDTKCNTPPPFQGQRLYGPLMNGAATHEWTILYDANHRSYVKNKLSKKHFASPLFGDP